MHLGDMIASYYIKRVLFVVCKTCLHGVLAEIHLDKSYLYLHHVCDRVSK